MIALLFAAALACTPSAHPGRTALDSTAWDGPPPKRYQSHASFTLTTVDRSAISGICDDGVPPPCPLQTDACTIRSHVYVPDPCLAEFKGESFAALLCHEKGHVDGWPATHGR